MSRLGAGSVLFGIATFCLVFLTASAAEADSGGYRAIGTLSCLVRGPDVVLHFASKRTISCTFRSSRSGRRYRYAGVIQKYGFEVGFIGDTTLKWTVTSRSGRISRRSLAGEYTGFSVEATLGLGAGANVITREGDRAVRLVPVGVQAQKGGFNAAAGVTSIVLTPAR